MAATRTACPLPLDGLEKRYMAALAAARSWRIEGTKLMLLDAHGGTAIVLEKAE